MIQGHIIHLIPDHLTQVMQLQEDRFNRNESVRSSKEKKEVTKQIYRIKKDGHECVVSDLISNNKEPVTWTLATKGEEMKDQTAKSEITKKAPKIKKELPLCQAKSQPGCPLGLSMARKKIAKA